MRKIRSSSRDGLSKETKDLLKNVAWIVGAIIAMGCIYVWITYMMRPMAVVAEPAVGEGVQNDVQSTMILVDPKSGVSGSKLRIGTALEKPKTVHAVMEVTALNETSEIVLYPFFDAGAELISGSVTLDGEEFDDFELSKDADKDELPEDTSEDNLPFEPVNTQRILKKDEVMRIEYDVTLTGTAKIAMGVHSGTSYAPNAVWCVLLNCTTNLFSAIILWLFLAGVIISVIGIIVTQRQLRGMR